MQSPEYKTWHAMMARCTNLNDQAYSKYGGIGISVCDEWRSFRVFLEDMGSRPDGTSLDRIDNSLGYNKSNCRWSTRKSQNRNRSICRQVTLDGETKTLSEWAESLGVHRHAITRSVDKGITSIDAILAHPKRPVQTRRASSKGNYVTVDGVTRKITEWAAFTGIAHSTIWQRVKYGWTIEDAVSTPKNKKS